MGGGSNCPCAPLDPNRRQCLALEPTAEVDFFTTKLGVVVHNLAHQLSITCWRMTPSCWL